MSFLATAERAWLQFGIHRSSFLGQLLAPSLAHGLNGRSSSFTLAGCLRCGCTHMYALVDGCLKSLS